jgi:hypothetical protein
VNSRDQELLRMAEWLALHPANGDGADKTFVLEGARRLRRLAFMPRVLVGIGDGPRRTPTPEELAWPVVTQPIDDVIAVCLAFEEAGVPYMVIGAFGIHLHAMRGGVAIPTEDCDVLLPCEARAVAGAIEVLRRLGFELQAGGEPLIDPDDVIIAGILRARVVVRAARGDAQFDLVLDAAALRFEDLWPQHRAYVVEGHEIRVAPLDALIRSKLAAGRTKDLLFLERFRELIEDVQARDRREQRERNA